MTELEAEPDAMPRTTAGEETDADCLAGDGGGLPCLVGDGMDAESALECLPGEPGTNPGFKRERDPAEV
jgi:hypothetical protein